MLFVQYIVGDKGRSCGQKRQAPVGLVQKLLIEVIGFP